MGVIFALLGGLFKSVATVARKALTEDIDTLWLAWLIQLVAVAGFLVIHLSTRPIAELGSVAVGLWMQVIVIGLCGFFAQYFNLKAISLADLSELVPLYSLVPVVTMFIAAIFIGELPHLFGGLGVIFITCGAYYLNINVNDKHIFDPLKNVLRKKSSQYVSITVLAWGITPVVDRFATSNYNSISWATVATISVFVYMSVALLIRQIVAPRELKRPNLKLVLVVGIGIGLGYLMSVLAVNLMLASYAVAIRRMDIIFTIILSWIFLHDPLAIKRLKGASIMVIGAIIVALS